MAPEAKNVRFNLRVSEAEVAMMNKLADVLGVSASDVVRMLVRREYETRFGSAKPKPAKKK